MQNLTSSLEGYGWSYRQPAGQLRDFPRNFKNVSSCIYCSLDSYSLARRIESRQQQQQLKRKRKGKKKKKKKENFKKQHAAHALQLTGSNSSCQYISSFTKPSLKADASLSQLPSPNSQLPHFCAEACPPSRLPAFPQLPPWSTNCS